MRNKVFSLNSAYHVDVSRFLQKAPRACRSILAMSVDISLRQSTCGVTGCPSQGAVKGRTIIRAKTRRTAIRDIIPDSTAS